MAVPFLLPYNQTVPPCTNYFTSYDGVNEWTLFTNQTSTNLGRVSPASIVFWIKTDFGAGTQRIIMSKRMSTNVGWLLGLNTNGSIYFTSRTSGTNLVEFTTSSNFITADTWHFVVLTKAASGAASGFNVYVDGNLCTKNITQNTWTTNNTNTANFNIGTFRDGLGGFLDAYLDEVAIFGATALTQAQINTLYALGRNLPDYAGATGLTPNHWRMDTLNPVNLATGQASNGTSQNQDITNILCD